MTSITRTYSNDLYYRAYRLVCIYDTHTNTLLEVRIYAMGSNDRIDTRSSIDDARKVIDEWHNAR